MRVFIDIETVPQWQYPAQVPVGLYEGFKKKFSNDIHLNGGDVEVWQGEW